ncbi:MAG TPA: DUF934 domain-containing protein [Solimonas sp.]|nr:DUF934 domain-containing protein [Solimonas sp.]
MSHLIRNRQLAADTYRRLADDEPLPDAGKVIVSLARWQKEPALRGRQDDVGVQLPNTVDVAPLWPLLSERKLIVVEFPAFADGRAYSQARLLRERYRFAGEIRATGAAVVRDQLHAMARCGIDSLELRADQDPALCLRSFADFSLAYQSAADLAPAIWRRRRA